MSKTRNFFWPAAQSSQLLEFVAREKNFSGIYINLLTFLGARPHDVLSTGRTAHSSELTSCREAHERVLQACVPLERKSAPPRRCLVSSNCMPVPAPSDIVSAAPILKKSSNRLSSLNCWRLSVPRYLSCSTPYALQKISRRGHAHGARACPQPVGSFSVSACRRQSVPRVFS